MPYVRIVWVALLTAWLVASQASAQDFSIAAEPAKKKFDAKVEELRAKLQTDIMAATTDYAAKLDEQIKAVTAKGDLDKVLIYKAEKEWIEKDKAPTDTPASLKLVQTMRTAYEAKKKLANASFEKARKAAQAELFADLDAIVKEETKAGRLESALKVRELKQELEKAAAVAGTSTPPLPGPAVVKPPVKYLPGLVVREYPRQKEQGEKPNYVEPDAMTDHVGDIRLIASLNWKYGADHNAVAKGFIKIEKDGEYQFNSNSFYDRNALYVDDKLLCPKGDGEGKIQTIQLKAGYVPIVSVGMVEARGNCRVKWIPPDSKDKELAEIPATLFFHTAAQAAKAPPPKK
jgi:hypothetical protein